MSQVFRICPGIGPELLLTSKYLSLGTTSILPSGVCNTSPKSERLDEVLPLDIQTISTSVSANAPRIMPPTEPTPMIAILNLDNLQ